MLYTLFLLLLLLPTLVFAQALDRTHVAYRNPLQHGATCDATTLNAAITAIGTAKETLFITRTDRAKVNCTWTLAANVTTNVNTEVYIPNGVVLSVNTGITVTFNGPVVVDDPVGSLTGAGTYVFNKKLWGQPQAFEDMLSNFVKSGGLHAVPSPASLTTAAFATRAWLNGVEVNQGATAITYAAAANDVCWTIVSSDNDGITGWTRIGTTAYYYQCEGDTTPNQPALPANSLFLMRVTIASSAITAVSPMFPQQSMRLNTLTRVHNVRDYGATGDDVTNDAPAFQRAITAASVVPGGMVWVPPGTYRWAETVTMNFAGLHLRCAGLGSQIIYTGTGNMLEVGDGVANFNDVHIKECNLQTTQAQRILYIRNSNNFRISDNSLSGASIAAVSITNSTTGTLANNVIGSLTGSAYGIYQATSANSNTYIGNRVDGVTGGGSLTGFYSTGSSGVGLYTNVFEGLLVGINLFAGQGAAIVGNYFEGTRTSILNAVTGGWTGAVVMGNFFGLAFSTADIDIDLANMVGFVSKGNRFDTNSTYGANIRITAGGVTDSEFGPDSYPSGSLVGPAGAVTPSNCYHLRNGVHLCGTIDTAGMVGADYAVNRLKTRSSITTASTGVLTLRSGSINNGNTDGFLPMVNSNGTTVWVPYIINPQP